MENQPVTSATYLIGAVHAPNPLEAALRAVTARVQQRAEAAGLPAVIVSARFTQPAGGSGYLTFSLTAAMAGQQWHEAPVQVDSRTLEAVEVAFDEQLTEFELQAYEADPSRYIDAQIEAYQALEAYA
ncbi:MAG: hypothetical protein ACRYFK_14475 [Janthinobacterium lividum]